MPLDFSANKYRLLCENLAAAGYHSIRFVEYVTSKGKNHEKKRVILRHDVDRFPASALALAQIEHSLGMTASYYFRVPNTFQPKIISAVHSLGHEIGLHYEVLDKARGDIIRARQFLEQDLKHLREISPVETVAMHGNPLTPFDNRDIWDHLELGDYGLVGEAYLSVDFNRLSYFSDTGRTWKRNHFNIYDRPPLGSRDLDGHLDPKSTDDLIKLIQNSDKDMYILTHPERWPVSFAGWLLSYAKDIIANPLKLIFQLKHRIAGRS